MLVFAQFPFLANVLFLLYGEKKGEGIFSAYQMRCKNFLWALRSTVQILAVLKACAHSLQEETKKLKLTKKQQETATVGRLSLLNTKRVKLIRYHRALSCILLNYSNLKWFLSRWKFLAAAVNRKRKWLSAMIFNKNVTSYYSELCSPIVFPVNNLPHSLKTRERCAATWGKYCSALTHESETL